MNGIDTHLYATKWFLTLYISVLPSKLALRVFDCFLSEKTKILYRIALAILKIKETKLMKMKDMEEILDCLNIFDEKEFQDEEVFFKIAFEMNFYRENIRVKSITKISC